MKRYRNPPIVETICGFQFMSEKPWDLTLHGLIYDRVKETYPNKKQLQGLEFELRATPAGFEQKMLSPQSRTQFFSVDERSLIQVGPDMLVVNKLKPYSSWEDLRPTILEAFRVYDEIAKPKGFRRIGLRYINKIGFPEEKIKLDDYFTVYPNLPPNLPQQHGEFMSRVEIPYAEGRDRLLITFASSKPDEPARSSVVLDLDYVLVSPETVPKEKVDAWIEEAHGAVEYAFEACITDNCRAVFGVLA